MAVKRDYYEVLGVARTASGDEIASAYRRLAIKFHPDRNPDDEDAPAKFKEAAEAYEVLRDSEKRSRYNQFGHAGLGGAGQAADMDDFVSAFGDILGGGIFGDLFGGAGGGGGRRGRAQRGANLRVQVELTLEEAATGVKRDITVRRDEVCETCDGSGAKPGTSPVTCSRCGGRGAIVQQAGILRVQTTCPKCGGQRVVIDDPCPTCRGHRVVPQDVTLTITIPAGIDDGQPILHSGEGEPSPTDGPPGDLYVVVRVRPHKLFKRDGRHLLLEVPITFSQAALGATVTVASLDGRAELTIPPGTPSGEIHRLRGRGLPDPSDSSIPRGDLLIQTNIEVPKKLSKRQEDLLRELAELESKEVTAHRKSFFETIKEFFTGDEDEIPAKS